MSPAAHAQVKDRQVVAERMRAHVQAPDSTPLLIFPEGTCGAACMRA
jgi:glycerol-3-phosphate O-acyltransferase 3/4